MVSLDKTADSIALGGMRAAINAELRNNNPLALFLEFGERIHAANAARFEAHKVEVLTQ